MKLGKRAIKNRIQELLAREIGSTRFQEAPEHIMDEPDEVINAWPQACIDLADKLRKRKDKTK